MPEGSLPLFPEDEPRPSDPPAKEAPGTRGRPLTITEINAAVREMLEGVFSDVWLQGEISNFKAHGSGHFYFSLKDSRAQISAVMFRGNNVRLRFRPEDGLSVLARGVVSLYEARGSYQINVSWMEPLGAGSLQLAFEQLKARLKEEGLFDADRKRPIPGFPRRIGVVTSPTGAALRDILNVLERRAAGLDVLIAPCRVQGEGAAQEIAAAVGMLNAHADPQRPLDAIIVARGGGSLEDLWAFNEEIVARAIAASRLPVISAVGHETDFTIADFTADLRAPTPSAAAELVVMSREELVSRVGSSRVRLGHAARRLVLERRNRVHALARSRAFARVESALASARQRSDEALMKIGNLLLGILGGARRRLGVATERLSPRSLKAEVASRRGTLRVSSELLHRAVVARLRALREELSSREALLQSLSPLSVLERGYAICQLPATGAVITSAHEVSPGDEVRVRLARGRLEANVTRTSDGESEPVPES